MKEHEKTIYTDIVPLMAPSLAGALMKMAPKLAARVTEIRIRASLPLSVVAGCEEWTLGADGNPSVIPEKAYRCSADDVTRSLQLMSVHSLYAFEPEIRQGYLTLPGGHRVGVAGQVAAESGQVRAFRRITSLNVRIAREVTGCADRVMPYLYSAGRPCSTLVVGPPRTGKTTFLRDLVRQFSSGVPSLGMAGFQVGLVDERSEIAACRDGLPTVDLGPRTDWLDGCPKAVGLLMLIRSMGPAVVVTDEIGRAEDGAAVLEALNAGVSVIASIHGESLESVAARPQVGALIAGRAFDRCIILGSQPSVGTVAGLIRTQDGKLIYADKGVKACG